MPARSYIITDPDTFDLDEATGYYGFDDMLAAFQPRSNQLEPIVRPGKDGEELRALGVRAQPTPMRTLLAVNDRDDAEAAITSYVSLKDGLPYEIVQHEKSWGFFRVREVAPQPIVPLAAIAGWLIPTATVLLVVDWLVLATPEPEAP